MNLWDILIAALVIAFVILGIRSMARKKKSGGCACGDCASCAGCAAKRTADGAREETNDK
jgi:hypothetical protein